uniref:Uncharacterized protein n=1 Tax=Rhizophora mucronata TaxID=61149 RepID=A0A2P2KCQ3_RHIMU
MSCALQLSIPARAIECLRSGGRKRAYQSQILCASVRSDLEEGEEDADQERFHFVP